LQIARSEHPGIDGRRPPAEEGHAVVGEQLDDVLRFEAFRDHRLAASGQWNEHALQEAVDVGEGRNGKENCALLGARRPAKSLSGNGEGLSSPLKIAANPIFLPASPLASKPFLNTEVRYLISAMDISS
jgi:hypothetical protein